MKIKVFTVEEANKLLPKMKDLFDDIYVLKKKIAFMKAEAEWIKEFWGNELEDSDNPDAEKYDFLKEQIGQYRTEIMRKVEKIQKFGCIVKDIDLGLIDFYSYINRELVFLCWQYGEKEIKYWHPIESSFGGRRIFTNMDKIE